VISNSNPRIVALRTEWDALSQENAFHYIKSLKPHWREDEFLQSGEDDVAKLVDPFLGQIGFDPRGMTMLEIGCGVGRMSFAFARRFAKVEAADISGEMVTRARDYQQRLGISNVQFQVVSGQDLGQYLDKSVDFCFSYIVFQHIPDISVILNYVLEMGRVLKEGGIALFQVNGFYRIELPRGYFLYGGICETGRLRKWNVESRPCLRFGKLNSWDGVPISVRELTATCQSAGLGALRFSGVGTQYMWLSGKKLPGSIL
jgi:SAM-dependent methyltransferase